MGGKQHIYLHIGYHMRCINYVSQIKIEIFKSTNNKLLQSFEYPEIDFR